MAANIATSNEPTLRPTVEPRWRRGFVNLLRKENHHWWGTRRGLVQSLLWLIIVNGIVGIMLWVMPWSEGMQGTPMTPEAVFQAVIITLAPIIGTFGTIGIAIVAQSAIVGEKQQGTTAWILSKPVARSSIILAKLVAYSIGIIVTLIVLPGALAYALIAFRIGGVLAFWPYVAGLAMLGLHSLFYLSLTLLLGTLANGRGPVIAVPVSLLFLQQFISGYLGPIRLVLPGTLTDFAPAVILQQPLPATAAVPITATLIWSIICIALAVWRFGQDEF